MTRLSLKQLLLAIAVGAVFAALQVRAPAMAADKAPASTAACAPAAMNRC